MNVVEEIMIVTGIIKVENTITLFGRRPESGTLLHIDAPHVMIHSIDYISDDYSTLCTDSSWCVCTYKNRMRCTKVNVMYQSQRMLE